MMQDCEFCVRARDISRNLDGYSLVRFCRTCFRQNAKKEALAKERQRQREQKSSK